MNSVIQNLSWYLQEVGITAEKITVNLENLNLILQQHIQAFTFENIALFLAQPFDLDLESIVDKFLLQSRELLIFITLCWN